MTTYYGHCRLKIYITEPGEGDSVLRKKLFFLEIKIVNLQETKKL